MPFVILGIDPGLEGALAFIDPIACTLHVVDMPTFSLTVTKKKNFVDEDAIADILHAYNGTISHAFIEQVASSPQMGVVSAFSFGQGYGSVNGVLAGLKVPRDKVLPQEWKKQMRAPRDKKESKARAVQLMPACASILRRPDRAEAAMIAFYGCLRLGHPFTKPVRPAGD